MYQLVFDDRSAPTAITESVFNKDRKAYLALPVDQQQTGAHVEPPPRRKPQSRQTNSSDQQSAASSSSSSIDNNITNAPTVRNTTTIPSTTVVISSTVPTTSSNIACAIHECAEYCAPTSTICNDYPNSERCYLCCSLNVMHTSHANQSAPRRINTSIIVAKNNNTNTSIQAKNIMTPTTSSSNSNSINIATNPTDPPLERTLNNITATIPTGSNIDTTAVVRNARGGPQRKKKKYNPDSEEFCWCGCNLRYNYTCMSQCKGVDCENLVN